MKKNIYSGPLFIASDHGGYKLKKRLVRFIKKQLHIDITDLGPSSYTQDDDYSDYVLPLTKKVLKLKARGIVICKNGIGVSIVANKVTGIRAGVGYNLMAAETMMTDDDTNVLALAAKGVSEEHAMAIVEKWLISTFSNAERHVRRLKKIERVEKNKKI